MHRRAQIDGTAHAIWICKSFGSHREAEQGTTGQWAANTKTRHAHLFGAYVVAFLWLLMIRSL